VKLLRHLNIWAHKKWAYPKDSMVIGRWNTDNEEICQFCNASRTAIKEMIALGGKSNLTTVDVMLTNCPTCKRAIEGVK